MNDIKKLLGLNIKEYRKANNLTQEQLAELVGIGTANISYIETGKFAPSLETLKKLSEIFKIYPYELYMFEHHKSSEELLEELFSELQKNDKLLKLVYKFYKVVK